MTSAEFRAALALALILSAPALAQQTARMSYQESSAIKRSMLPPGTQMRDFELDHIIPLCLGGSNDRSNLQLQPWPEARIKDDDEIAACKAVSAGWMSRDEAIKDFCALWKC